MQIEKDTKNGETVTDDDRPVWMRPERFGKLIEYRRSKVYQMLRTGEIRGAKIGGAWRIHVSELDRLKQMVAEAAE